MKPFVQRVSRVVGAYVITFPADDSSVNRAGGNNSCRLWYYKAVAEGARRKKLRFWMDKKIMIKKKHTSGCLNKHAGRPGPDPGFPGRAVDRPGRAGQNRLWAHSDSWDSG